MRKLPGVTALAVCGLTAAALAWTGAGNADAATRPRPVTARDLQSAPVPPACTHPKGRLRNGSLPGLTAGQGFEALDVTSVRPVFADVTGDRVGDAVTVLHCSAGGVDWPRIILVYGPGPALLSWLDLGRVTRAEHADPVLLRVVRRDVVLEWHTYDGCCFHNAFWGATLHLQGKKLVVQRLHRVTPAGGSAGAARVATAWYAARRAGATARARQYEASDYNVPAGSSAVPARGAAAVTAFRCTGASKDGILTQHCVGPWVERLSTGQFATFEEVDLRGVGSAWKVTHSTQVSGE